MRGFHGHSPLPSSTFSSSVLSPRFTEKVSFVPTPGFRQGLARSLPIFDRLRLDLLDGVAHLDTRLFGRAAGVDFLDHDPVLGVVELDPHEAARPVAKLGRMPVSAASILIIGPIDWMSSPPLPRSFPGEGG